MFMLRKALFLVALSLVGAMTARAEEHLFRYQAVVPVWRMAGDTAKDLDVAMRLVVIDSDKRAILFGHSGNPYSSCNGRWLCISSLSFNFAVPKEGRDLPLQWEYGGFRFLNKGLIEIAILGVPQLANKVEVISLSRDDVAANPALIYFSRDRGIVGFTLLWYEDGVFVPETYFSTTDYGYLAAQ